MITVFKKDDVGVLNNVWPDVASLNEVLERLATMKVAVVSKDGHFKRSKIAWKVGVLYQAFLYRVVMLGEGVVQNWRSGNIIGAMLCSRALMETTAVFIDIAEKLERLTASGDIPELDNLMQAKSFSTRLQDWITEGFGTNSVNVLTLINSVDKSFNGFRKSYDFLSEICHPNYLGHYNMFADVDQKTADVAFSDTKVWGESSFEILLSGYGSLPLFETAISRVGKIIPDLVATHLQWIDNKRLKTKLPE